MPTFRLLFGGGHFAVAVFFVASGYALSATPLRLIQAATFGQLGEMIALGSVIYWISFHVNRTGHTGTRYAGLPVRSGKKMGMNIWPWHLSWTPPNNEE
jgi:hypothetical protein